MMSRREVPPVRKHFRIDPNTDMAAIKAQYKQLAKRFHPDVSGSSEVMKEINVEFEWLKTHHVDPPKRMPVYARKLYRVIPDEIIDTYTCVIPENTFSEDVTIFFMIEFKEFMWSHSAKDSPPHALDVSNIGRPLRIVFSYERGWMLSRNLGRRPVRRSSTTRR